jgi:tetratricopeptide (TPR) repeat protein
MAPEYVAERLPLAEEQIDVAASAGEGLLVLLGLMWRTVDLYHLGDPVADRSLAELHERADALACRSILYVAECMEVMRLLRAGRLDDAEAAAVAALELGTEVGDPDAIGYYGGQLLTLRWLQDRDEETYDLVTEVAGSTTLVLPEFTFRASVALLAARAGRFDEARRALDALAADHLDELPRSSTWLSGMCCIVEAARTLGDAGVAEQAHALLAPFADLPVMPSFAITCLGSVERFLGLAALTFGEQAAAIAHLERGLAANRRLGNRPLAAITRADLAEALAARGEADDVERALALLETAVAEASGIGMVERAATWAGRADALRRRRAASDPRPEIVMRADGRRWIMTAGDRRVVVPDLVGLRYLATLLDRPGQDVSALELCGAAGVDPGRHEVLDGAAIAAYRRRARDLAADIAAAEADADLARAERLRVERDVLVEEVSSAVGLGGRSRAFVSAGERARTAVRKAIKRAIDTIAGLDQDLGERLRAEVETGTTCRYSPR